MDNIAYVTARGESSAYPTSGEGAPKARPLEPWPKYTEEQVAAVADVLRSGRVNQWTGDQVAGFERDYASHLNRTHAIALMNGTVALELALRTAGVGPGDEVVTTPRTFIASASAAVLQGARPVLADVDRDSGAITAATIEAVTTPKTKAVVVVHLGGWPAEMREIQALAAEKGFVVIEDCAQAHGATVDGRPVGSMSDMAAFSFCNDKIITTGGEGGMLVLDDEDWFKAAWSFKDHGKGYDTTYHTAHPPGYQWLHDGFGTNWRMTELQAALGRLQLRDLEETVSIRTRNALLWHERLSGLGAVRVPQVRHGIRHAFYRLYAYLVPEALKPGWDRQRIQDEVEAAGFPIRAGSCGEIYRERAFTDSGLAPAQPLPVASELAVTSLAFPVHPTLAEATIHSAADVFVDVVRRATR